MNYLRCVGAAGAPHRVHQRRACQPVPIPLPHQDQKSWGHQSSLSPRDWAPPWGRREAKAKPRGGPAARPGWAGPIRQGRAVGSWRPALMGPCWGPRTDMAAWAMWETQGPDRDRQSWQCLRAMVAKININMQHCLISLCVLHWVFSLFPLLARNKSSFKMLSSSLFGLFFPWGGCEAIQWPPLVPAPSSQRRRRGHKKRTALSPPLVTQLNSVTSSANLEVWAHCQVTIYTFFEHKSIFTYKSQGLTFHSQVRALWAPLHNRSCRWLLQKMCFNKLALFCNLEMQCTSFRRISSRAVFHSFVLQFIQKIAMVN